MKKLLLLITVLMVGASAYAQIEAPVKWAYAAKRISPTEAVVFFRANMDLGWHIYALDVKDGGPIKTSFTFTPSPDYVLEGKVTGPAPVTNYVKSFDMEVGSYEGTVTFQQKVKLKSANATTVKGQLEYMTCNDRKCLPAEDVDFSIPIGK